MFGKEILGNDINICILPQVQHMSHDFFHTLCLYQERTDDPIKKKKKRMDNIKRIKDVNVCLLDDMELHDRYIYIVLTTPMLVNSSVSLSNCLGYLSRSSPSPN